MKKTLLASLLLLTMPYAIAEGPTSVPNAPDIPPQVESGEVLEPDVTITESERGLVEEYSINGRTYMVKITPSSGAPYYLLDSDGDGTMDVRQESHPAISPFPSGSFSAGNNQ